MNEQELRKKLEERGFEVKRIRVFKNSFHVNYWTKEAKMVRYYRVPLSSVSWKDIQGGYY